MGLEVPIHKSGLVLQMKSPNLKLSRRPSHQPSHKHTKDTHHSEDSKAFKNSVPGTAGKANYLFIFLHQNIYTHP